MDQQKKKLKTIVDIPISLMNNMESQLRDDNSLKMNVIQEEFIILSQKLKYGTNDIFFILDGKGNMINHPLRPDLSWWNMLYETDSEGVHIFRDFINKTKKDGSVYLKTNWVSKYNNEIFEEQIIYGQYFWPWDWIVCTVIYSEDLDTGENIMDLITYGKLVIAYIIYNIFLLLILRIKQPKESL